MPKLSRPDILFYGGVLMLAIAVAGTCAGKLPGRFGGFASRTKNPGQYWSSLAGYYLVGIGFIGYYIYETHLLSN